MAFELKRTRRETRNTINYTRQNIIPSLKISNSYFGYPTAGRFKVQETDTIKLLIALYQDSALLESNWKTSKNSCRVNVMQQLK